MKINAICGGIYASGIAGLSFLKKHSNILQKKHTNPRSEFFGKPFPTRPTSHHCCNGLQQKNKINILYFMKEGNLYVHSPRSLYPA